MLRSTIIFNDKGDILTYDYTSALLSFGVSSRVYDMNSTLSEAYEDSRSRGLSARHPVKVFHGR